MKRKVFFPILAAAIIASVFASSNLVSAQDVTSGPNSLVAAIAAKFNLNQSDVQAVFDEERSKHEAEMKTQMEAKLTQAVKDGKITEAQKQAIQEKFGQPFTKKIEPGQFKDMSEEEMKAFHDQKKAEMDAWLSQNGLTRETLQEIMGGPRGFGRKGMMFKVAH